jgi:hypothetical protein
MRALAGGLLIAVLLSAFFAAGRSYLWCVPMQRVMEASCCGDRGDAQNTAASRGAPVNAWGLRADEPRYAPKPPAVRASCCEARALEALPQAALRVPQAAPMPPALAAVLLPLSPVLARPAMVPRAPGAPSARAAHAPIRAGPGSPSARCSLLQVFRC